MSEAIDSIETHIQETRKDLGENLQALEEKVKSITDWRQYIRAKRMLTLGAVIGGIILVARSLRRRKPRGWLRPA